MAITYVGTKTATITSPTATTTKLTGFTITAGNMMVLTTKSSSSVVVNSVTDNRSQTWYNPVFVGTGGPHIEIWYVFCPNGFLATDFITATLASGTNQMTTISVSEVAGANASFNSIDVMYSGFATGSVLNTTHALTSSTTQKDIIFSAIGTSGASGQTFTANGTFTIPTGVTLLKITVVGGGGGGGSYGYGTSYICAGGGGGGCAIRYLTGLTPGNTLAVTVGAAGTAGANSNGGSGGSSTVASGTQTVTTTTGSGGGGGSGSYTSANTPGAGGTGTNGSINISGGPGGQGANVAIPTPCYAIYFGYGGGGGGSALGSGAPISAYNNAGINGGGVGGGGGGSFTNIYGGAGTAGAVIIEW